MPRFPSAEWFQEFCDAINASAEHVEAAAGWEGDVTLAVEADPECGVHESVWGWFDLWHGGCRQWKVVSEDEGERARFVIRAPYARWKEVITGRLEPVRGMREGKLRLAGDLPKVAEYIEAVRLLVGLAGAIPTEFPDE